MTSHIHVTTRPLSRCRSSHLYVTVVRLYLIFFLNGKQPRAKEQAKVSQGPSWIKLEDMGNVSLSCQYKDMQKRESWASSDASMHPMFLYRCVVQAVQKKKCCKLSKYLEKQPEDVLVNERSQRFPNATSSITWITLIKGNIIGAHWNYFENIYTLACLRISCWNLNLQRTRRQ